MNKITEEETQEVFYFDNDADFYDPNDGNFGVVLFGGTLLLVALVLTILLLTNVR